MFWIVVPDGMPMPVMVSPSNSPVVLLMPVTNVDPLVTVPVKLVGAVVTPVTVSGTEGSPLVVSWKKTWTSLRTNVAGLTGRSKVTEMLTVPLVASASGIGPIVLVMIRGPAAMTIGRYQMLRG